MNPNDFADLFPMLFRLGIATILGGVLGVERDLHRKPAGVRVLAMVCLGAAAITMVSVVAVSLEKKTVNDGVLRTIQGVLSGIGFLGAGVIMRTQGTEEVHGMTTAAAIWVAAILGMVCGLGQWTLALCTFGLAWVILRGGRWVEAQVLKYAAPHEPLSSEIIREQKSTP